MTTKMASTLVTALWIFGGMMGVGVAISPVGVGLLVSPQVHAHPGHSQCQEDQDCWNCAEMGNRICGNSH